MFWLLITVAASFAIIGLIMVTLGLLIHIQIQRKHPQPQQKNFTLQFLGLYLLFFSGIYIAAMQMGLLPHESFFYALEIILPLIACIVNIYYLWQMLVKRRRREA